MDDDIKLPEPFGYVSDFKHAGIRIMSFQHAPWDQTHSLYHSTREVYTADQVREAVRLNAQAAPAAQQPLTDEQIAYVLFFGESTDQSTKDTFTAVARAIEQAATSPLLARIAEIEAELEKTKAIFAASCNHAAVIEMERDAKRWRAMRQTMVAVDFEPEMGGSPVVMFELHAKTVRAGPEGADEIADAAMKEQGHG